MRHPFPGPGLGGSNTGEIKKSTLTYCEADAIFIEELRNADLYSQVSRLAVYLPVKSVGVVGDAALRTRCRAASCGNNRLYDRALGPFTL